MEIDVWGNIVAENRKKTWTDFSSFEMKERLAIAGKSDVDVRFNSMGGEVTEGNAIRTLLSSYEGNVTTHLMGMCGSIATMGFLSGKERIVYPTSMFFIHEAKGARADDLEKMNDMMANVYSEATGKSVEFFRDEMKKEKTYYGAEILEMGIATKMGEQLKAVALLDIYNKPQTVKEPEIMAMTEKEQADFEALKAENKALKDGAVAEKEQLEREKLEFAKAYLDKETERKDQILACARYPEQKELAEALYKEGLSVVEAKAKIFDHFLANESSFTKSTALAQLEQGSPAPSGGDDGSLGGGEMTPEACAKEWMSIENVEAKATFYEKHKDLIAGVN